MSEVLIMFLKKKRLRIESGPQEKSVRFLCILQLIVVFSVFCWNLGYPFLGAMYEVKQEKILYDYVFQPQNALYYAELPRAEKVWLEKKSSFWKSRLEGSFRAKMKESLMHMYFKMPRLELWWVILSVVACVMVLKQADGFRAVIWFLPLLTALFIFENVVWGEQQKMRGDSALYPSESEIQSRYIPEGLSGTPFEQQNRLSMAWDEYLKDAWGNGDLKKGEFSFTLARIKAREGDKILSFSKTSFEKEPVYLLALYFIWNVFLAWKVSGVDYMEELKACSGGAYVKISV